MSLDEKVKEIVAHAYAHAPAVKARFDEAGIDPAAIQTVADLTQVPVLPKDQVIALQQANPPFGGMLAVPMSEVRRIFFSPGPIYEPDAGDISSPIEVAREVLRSVGFTADDVVINCLSYHLVPAGLLVDWALVAHGCSVIPAGIGNSDLQLKLMIDSGATAYAGTPSYLMSLIQKAEGQGLDFREAFNITKAVVTAEPMPMSLRQTLTDKYGIQVCNAYGTAEFGFLAYNIGEGLGMKLLPEPIIQVVDPDTGAPTPNGEVGEVVVTNLNLAYPLIRYGTGDMAINMDPNEGESAQHEREIIIVGRRGEAAKVRGMFVHPNQLRFGITQVGMMFGVEVKGVQGVVTRPDQRDELAVRVALDGEAPAGFEAAVAQAVQQACRIKADRIEIVPPDALGTDAPGMDDQRSWD